MTDLGKPQSYPPTTDGKEKVAQEAEKVNAYLESRRKYSLAGYEAEQSGLARKYSIDAGTASLVGLHEISEEKLRKAIALGGLANPSLGVVDLNARAGTGFGAITLIAPRTLIDKKTGRNAGTYAGDAWTPMVPQVKLIGNRETREKMRRYVDSVVADKTLAGMIKHDAASELDGEGTGNDHLSYVFLRERGIDVPNNVVALNYPQDTTERAEKILGGRNFDVLDVKTDAQRKALTELYFELHPDAAKFKEDFVGKDGTLNDYALRDLLSKIRRDTLNGGKIDYAATLSDARDYIRNNGLGLRDEYEAWKREKFVEFGAREKFFNGRTESGSKRWAEATLENLSKAMNREKETDANDDSSFGAIRAGVLKWFSSLGRIRENKNLLALSDAEIRAVVDEATNKVSGLVSELAYRQKISENDFINFDYAARRLKEAFAEEDPKSYLENEYGYEIEEELAQELSAVKELLQNLPAKYFETKFRRPVGLGEFRAAVVPAGTDAAVVSALKNAGVSVEEYASDDAEDRAAKVRGVAAKASDVRFSLAMEASADAEYLEPSDFGEDGRVKPEVFAEIEAEKAKIREDAQKNGTFGKAPNGAPSKLNADQWVLVRTKRFKRWFGDWEKAFAKKHLEESEAIPVASGQIKATDEKSAIKVAAEWAEKHLPVKLGDTEIVFDARSVKTTLSHKYSQAKLDALTSIPEGFKNAVFLGESKDFSRDRAFDSYYAYPIVYEGSRRIVFCRAIKDPNSNRLYLHEVFLEEKLKADSLQTAAASVRKGPAQEPHGGIRLMKNILFDVYRVNEENVSRVVDENGEPNVVYHGTGETFSAFSKEKLGSFTGAKSANTGFFFSDNFMTSLVYYASAKLRGELSRSAFREIVEKYSERADKSVFRKSLVGHDEFMEALGELERMVGVRGVKETAGKHGRREISLFGQNVGFYYENNPVVHPNPSFLEPEVGISSFSAFDFVAFAAAANENLSRTGGAVMACFLNLRKPKVYHADKRRVNLGKQIVPRKGIDGYAILGIKDPLFIANNFVVLEPEQIKSATENAGTYAPENPDIRYSISTEEQDAWNGVLDAYEAGKLRGDAEYKVLERVPTVWKACGIDDLPIVISGNALNKITKEKHGIAVGDLRDLLTNIDDPIAVFTSKTRPEDSVVVLVEIMDANTGEKSVVSVAIDQNVKERGKRVNKITSIYGRPARQILGFMNDGLALYVNQQKSRAYLRANRLQLPAAASKRGNPSLLTEEDFPMMHLEK